MQYQHTITIMIKTTIRSIVGASLLATVLLPVSATFAESAISETQTSSETSTTTSAGTISEFGPNVISIRSESSSQPIRYSYSKTTTYVDESGAPVSMETVKSGLPVTVYYVKHG